MKNFGRRGSNVLTQSEKKKITQLENAVNKLEKIHAESSDAQKLLEFRVS